MAWNLCRGSLSFLLLFISVGNSVVRGGHRNTAAATTVEDRVQCNGTHNQLSSGPLRWHYERMRLLYSGCTHVEGNLEITHLTDRDIDYDLSFLRDIQYVSGYVLIAVDTRVQEIPLHSLEIIRGNSTFPFRGADYALAVLLTYPISDRTAGLKELQLPSLKEITNGKVGFTLNPSLGFVDTIDWEAIARHRPDPVDYLHEAYNATVSRSIVSSLDCPSGHMWGRGMCQSDIPDISCHPTCDGRCFGPGSGECCHGTCAVGCRGPSNQDCLYCKDYEYNTGCVGFCPSGTHRNAGICVPH